nr:hypothetical protein Iba_chr04fCG5520 [Ipomoea batatas]
MKTAMSVLEKELLKEPSFLTEIGAATMSNEQEDTDVLKWQQYGVSRHRVQPKFTNHNPITSIWLHLRKNWALKYPSPIQHGPLCFPPESSILLGPTEQKEWEEGPTANAFTTPPTRRAALYRRAIQLYAQAAVGSIYIKESTLTVKGTTVISSSCKSRINGCSS